MTTALLVGAALLACTAVSDGFGNAAKLQARHAELRTELANNEFGRKLYLESTESGGAMTGDAFAVVERPFVASAASLTAPQGWCDVLILHINTKYCRPALGATGTVLNVNLGRKFPQSLDATHRLQFAWSVAARTAGYFDVRLQADQGPLGTSDYCIRLEAVPASAKQTFIHLTYSYKYGSSGALAMRAYLASLGRNEVGFTVAGHDSAGRPVYVRGVRGILERNTMRYYLAIDAYLASLAEPASRQLDSRLRAWFAATEHYPLQLGGGDLGDYLEMKTAEYRRQQAE